MDPRDAVELIRAAVPGGGGPAAWADIGAGRGTFTAALARLLGPGSRIYAVERDARSLAALGRRREWSGARVIPVDADFSRPFELPGLDPGGLDGMLLANALHFARDAGVVLARLATRVRPGGRVVLVEYDRRRAGPWVPYPIPPAGLPALADAAGLTAFRVVATRPSDYSGVLYAAAADRRTA
ncbi:MAG TPA: class I SAM-dependent methyltransferase [Candidatus Eisenbacteria bacterium]